MLYILYGQDTFRRDEKLRHILDAYVQKHPQQFGLVKLDADEADARALSAALESSGLFETIRLAVARNFIARHREGIQKFIVERGIAKDPARVLVLVEEEVSKEANELLQLGKAQRFDLLSEQKARVWVRGRVEEKASHSGLPATIADNAVAFIAANAVNLWEAASVIEQAMLASAGKAKVELEDAVSFLVQKTQETVFPAGDALARRDAHAALAEIEKLSSQGEDAVQLSGFMISAIRNVYRGFAVRKDGKDGALVAKKFGTHPYVARKAFEASRNWDEQKIRTAMTAAVRLDYERKLSRIPPRVALDAFVLRTAQSSEPIANSQ